MDVRTILVAFVLSCGGEPTPRGDAGPPEVAGLTARIVGGTAQGRGAGTDVDAGATIQTTPSERAKVELSDRSVVLLERASRLVLAAGPRGIRLEAGQAVLEVPEVSGRAPLEVQLPEGGALVAGAKVAVRADDGRALVTVSRGEARLSGPRGAAVVRAGEEGVMLHGVAPSVGAAPDLGASIAWAEAGEADEESGLGSLRARDPRAPGGAEEPLRLAEHRVLVRISGPIARTEVEQTFSNDGERELEGTYRFPVPSGARVASMAVEVDGQWKEGRFVDRAVGERIWRGVQKNARLGGALGRVSTDDVLFAPGPWRDPALLAWEAGNRFSIRIHPIRAHAARKVRLAWVETLPRTSEGRRYVYPLPRGRLGGAGRSMADRFAIQVRIGGHDATKPVRVLGPALVAADDGGEKVLTLDTEGFVPAGDLVVETAETSDGEVRSATHRVMESLYAVVAVRPDLPRRVRADPIEHVILLDSSRSAQGEPWRREIGVAQALVREMDPSDRVTVLTCDVGCRPAGAPSRAPSGALATTLGETLARVEPGGTSDLVRSVEEGVLALGTATPQRRGSLVYVGDGVVTVGVRDPGRVGELAARAVAAPKATVSTIAVGSTADERMLSEIARRTGGVAIAYAPGDAAPSLALRLLGRLRGTALEGAVVTLPGAPADVAPAAIPTIRAGDEVWVGAKYAAAAGGDVVLRGSIDGEAWEQRWPIRIEENDAAGNAFVPSMWAERRAIDLAAGGDANREAVVALGVRHGLVTPFTSLLVLDSDALAQRLGLGASITPTQWTGEGEAEIAQGGPPTRVPLGGIGTSGAGRGGGSAGSGMGSGSSMGVSGPMGRGARQAMVRFGTPQVQGSLDREIVRRILRQHMGEIRHCFEIALNVRPDLAGDVGLTFTISPQGTVSASSIERSTVADERVGQCLASAARRWTFPMPEAGVVVVRQPLRFSVEEAPAPPPWGGGIGTVFRTGEVAPIEGAADGLAGAPQKLREGAEALRAKIAAEPDRRANHRALARLLAQVGEIGEGTAVVRAWLARDATDTEALTLLSDFLARAGDRDRAIRALASVAELLPGDKSTHERLAALYEHAGRTADACAHRVTLAALSPTDDAAAASATRCSSPPVEPAAPPGIGGELVVTAAWTGEVDLDVCVVAQSGTRVSWMGGRRGVRAERATATDGERLAVGFLPKGPYLVEVVRASGTGGAPADGTLDVNILGTTRRIPFRLEGARRSVARVIVSEGLGGYGLGGHGIPALGGVRGSGGQ